jgi:hypothetical protein
MRTPDETRKYARDHLVYEVEMLDALVKRFDRFKALLPKIAPDTSDPAEREVLDMAGRNADIESFGVHARNLYDFLYDSNRGTVTACDYFTRRNDWSSRHRPEKPKALEKLTERINIEIAHLGSKRRFPAVPWPYVDIAKALTDCMRAFIRAAEGDRLGEAATRRLSTLTAGQPGTLLAHSYGALVGATNTIYTPAEVGFPAAEASRGTVIHPLDDQLRSG